MKKVFAVLALALTCMAQTGSTYATIADITGTAATVPLSGTHVFCTMVQITALRTNTADVRYGGPLTAIARGSMIAPGGGQTEVWDQPRPLDLNTMFVYIASGDKVAVTCRQ